MKIVSTLLLTFLFSINLFAQDALNFEYEATEDFPFGQPHPSALPEIADWDPMIGICECSSQSRKQDGDWAEPIDMTWTWKYIMNGTAVQDITLKSDGAHSGSIRQYNTDSTKWYVHYFASSAATPALSSWEGGTTEDGKIVLYREQNAPNGSEGLYRLSFYNISAEGYDWVGEWVSTDESVVYPTWKISCTRKQ